MAEKIRKRVINRDPFASQIRHVLHSASQLPQSVAQSSNDAFLAKDVFDRLNVGQWF